MSLKNYRDKIDAIDAKIIEFLNDRAKLSQAIGREKLKEKKAIYSPGREKEVLRRIKELNKGPLSYEALQAIYQEIMSSSIALEKPLSIAHLGQQGAFTSSAARKKFGTQINYVPCATIGEVFQKVEHNECDYGVVPVENSVEGVVTHTVDLLVDYDLKISAQIMHKISHCLMAKAIVKDLKSIKNIYSNPQVFGQCRNWLAKHMPKAGEILVDSTTEAAQRAAKIKGSAAIASSEAAEINNLKILKSNIQDIAHNTTRFLVIGKQDEEPTGQDRTSILFSIKDQVGALDAMLKPFVENGINLTRIESRPSKKKAWEYYFFLDISGHRKDPQVVKALNQLEGICNSLKILGSYPTE